MQDYKEAYEIYLIDSEVGFRKMQELEALGSVQAMIFLGCVYRDGKNEVEKNLKKAELFFQKAFVIDSIIPGFYLGRFYFDMQDYKRAFEVLKKSASANYGPTLALLGYLYQNGIGTSQDIDVAIALYQRSLVSGNIWAKKRLSKIFISGERGFLYRFKGAIMFLGALIDGFYIAYKFSISDDRLLS